MYMARCGPKTNVLYFPFQSSFLLSKRLINKRFKHTLQIENEKNMIGNPGKNEIISPEDVEFKLAQLREFTNTLKERIHNIESVKPGSCLLYTSRCV